MNETITIERTIDKEHTRIVRGPTKECSISRYSNEDNAAIQMQIAARERTYRSRGK